MNDVLNTIRDSFEHLVAPLICGSDKTLASKIRVRMYQCMTVNYVAKQVEEKHSNSTFVCEDLTKYMVEALERLNVNVLV